MIVRHPNTADWDRFVALAASENWRVPQNELRLFQGVWSRYAHVLADETFCGLVTAVAYEKSAWIGNLLVPCDLRGRGYGSRLFKTVLAELVRTGVSSVWLTASEQGRTIYAQAGFVVVDCIERWVRPPSMGNGDPSCGDSRSIEFLFDADFSAWGERRSSLLQALCCSGKVLFVEGATALLQAGEDVQVIGPWYTLEAKTASNSVLLQGLVEMADPNVDIVVDLLASSAMQGICATAGFQYAGQTALMAYGNVDSTNLKSMVSLASLGSVG